jgi:trehalose 6-phosphate phosphatase
MLAPAAREPRGSAGRGRGREPGNRSAGERAEGPDRGAEDIGFLEALLKKPKQSSVIVDFDGTLAPIVPDPAAARAVPGAARTLGALSLTFDTVAVVSGRTAEFLARRLRPAGGALRIFGLYGMEEVVDREVHLDERVVAWLPIVAAAREAAERTAPSGVGIEDKNVSMTIHWRNSPAAAGWATGFAESQADRVGLRRRFGRMSVELMPPVDIDKGTTVGSLAAGMHAACFFGDDLSDLDAFKALDRLRRDGTSTVKVAVGDAESPPQVLKAADMVVDGPAEACRLLRSLATRARSLGGPRLV